MKKIIKCLWVVLVFLPISSFASVEIECNRGINRINGDKSFHKTTASEYKQVINGIYLYESSFDLDFNERVIFSVTSQHGQHYLMARLQSENNGSTEVLGYNQTNLYRADQQNNIKMSLLVRNASLMQKLVDRKGKDASQLDLMQSFDGSLGFDSLIDVEVVCRISGL